MHGYESSPRREFWAEFPGGFVHNPPYTSTTPQLLLNTCWLYYMHSFTTIKNNGFGHWDIAYSGGIWLDNGERACWRWRTNIIAGSDYQLGMDTQRWIRMIIASTISKSRKEDQGRPRKQFSKQRLKFCRNRCTKPVLWLFCHPTMAFLCVVCWGPRIVRLSK